MFGIVGLVAKHLNLPARRPYQARHQIHQSRLSRTVRAHQAGDSWRNRQIDPIHAENLPVELRYVFEDDAVVHRTTSYARTLRMSNPRQIAQYTSRAIHASAREIARTASIRKRALSTVVVKYPRLKK